MNSTRWLAGFGLMVFTASAFSMAADDPAPQAKPPDRWAPIRFLEGEWEGTAEGQSGAGSVRRTYSFILEGRYLFEKNISTYPPQEQNKAGEVHEHWSFFSHDRGRKTLILRQFHQEGFVNEYALDSAAGGTGKLVFKGERYENFDNSWQLRETYEVLSPDEFVEVFEIGAPGKELEVYSKNHFKRAKP